MSKYTTELRWPIEQALDDLNLTHEESNWPHVYKVIGLDDYPIFDEGYRSTLNDKIIRAYYFREIGFETMGLFRWHMRRTMFEMMPYYNQLYESEKLVTDPMLTRNMDYTEKWTRNEAIKSNQTDSTDRESDSTSNSNSSSQSNDRNVFQDTPMNGLDTRAIQDADYATNVTFDDATTSADSATATHAQSTDNMVRNRDDSGNYDGTKEHNEQGFDGSQSDLLLKYRETFVNIDLEIVDRLNELFMGLW